MFPRLFVANLPSSTQINDLFNLFSEFGEVEDIVIWKDQKNGISKAFIEMEEDDQAVVAINELDGVPWRGHTLRVREARSRPAKDRY